MYCPFKYASDPTNLVQATASLIIICFILTNTLPFSNPDLKPLVHSLHFIWGHKSCFRKSSLIHLSTCSLYSRPLLQHTDTIHVVPVDVIVEFASSTAAKHTTL